MNPKSGGPCQGIRNSIPIQKRAGIYNEVVTLDEPGQDFLETDDFEIHALGPVKGPYAYCGALKKWLVENLHRFDIAIIHGLWLYNSYGTFKVWNDLKNRNKKVPELYVMPHGMLDPYFQKAKSRRIKALRNWIFWNLIENHVVNGADGLLFTCEQEMELAKKTFSRYRPKRTLNIGYGILSPPEIKESDFRNFLEKCSGLNKQPYLLFLSRIHPKKGVDLLINSYLKLKNEGYKLPNLVIAGPGLDSSYGKEMLKLANDASIYFPGMLSGKIKWAAFYNCNAFVLPSHQENFGIAIVEALACKKAVLITNKVNVWREISYGNAGIISEDSPVGVYDMLKQWLLMTDKEKAEMSSNAFNVYREKFSAEKTGINMVSHITKCDHETNLNSLEKVRL